MFGNNAEKQSRLDVLDDLIKYMRKLELAKEEPEDALEEGINSVGDEMRDKEERELSDGEMTGKKKEPAVAIEIEGPEDEEETEPEAAELSPFQKKMKEYFNDEDRPKVGSSVSFMMASKKPMSKLSSDSNAITKKKRGRPFRNKG